MTWRPTGSRAALLRRGEVLAEIRAHFAGENVLEVDTPLLAQRPKQLSPAELATVLRPEDVAAVVAFVVGTPAHVCLNEIWVTPTHNRGYVAQMGRGS